MYVDILKSENKEGLTPFDQLLIMDLSHDADNVDLIGSILNSRG